MADKRLALLGEVAGQTEGEGDAAPMVRLDAGGGVDHEGVDALGRVFGDVLDVHAAFGRGDQRNLRRAAVDEQREVKFARDVDAVGDVQPVDLLANVAGLDRHQRVAEHVVGRGADLVGRLRQPDAALGFGWQLLELALAAPPGVDLRLDDEQRPGELARRRDRLVDGHRRIARRDRDAELGEEILRLIFVDVHWRGFPGRC